MESSGKYLNYGERETSYLKRKDKRLGRVIDRIGHIDWPIHDNLFTSLVFHIVGQQLSGKVTQKIWHRMEATLGSIEPRTLAAIDPAELRPTGMSLRKACYITELAQKAESGELDLPNLTAMNDRNVIDTLCRLRGVGPWTAEMLLLSSLGRPDILSYNDYGILRGMRMVYGHESIDRARFERYRRRLSPYGSVASLYFWAVAGGAIPELKDKAKQKPRT